MGKRPSLSLDKYCCRKNPIGSMSTAMRFWLSPEVAMTIKWTARLNFWSGSALDRHHHSAAIGAGVIPPMEVCVSPIYSSRNHWTSVAMQA